MTQWDKQTQADFAQLAENAAQALQKAAGAARAGCDPFDLHNLLQTAVRALEGANGLAADAATTAELKKSGLRP